MTKDLTYIALHPNRPDSAPAASSVIGSAGTAKKFLSSKLANAGDGLLLHYCPGCKSLHLIAVYEPFPNGAQWTFDGNAESPTFSPSINMVGVCHYFIRSGKIEFCGDSKHHLAGQTVDLPDLPNWSKNV